MPEDRKGFTQRTAMSNIDSIRSLFKKVTNSDYTIKIIRRNEFDPRNVLNPFTLPKAEKQEQKEETVSQNEAAVQKEDKLDRFFEQFESIITDGDKFALLNDTPTDPGEQSSFDDDEREEFLDEKEIMTDDEEDV